MWLLLHERSPIREYPDLQIVAIALEVDDLFDYAFEKYNVDNIEFTEHIDKTKTWLYNLGWDEFDKSVSYWLWIVEFEGQFILGK